MSATWATASSRVLVGDAAVQGFNTADGGVEVGEAEMADPGGHRGVEARRENVFVNHQRPAGASDAFRHPSLSHGERAQLEHLHVAGVGGGVTVGASSDLWAAAQSTNAALEPLNVRMVRQAARAC